MRITSRQIWPVAVCLFCVYLLSIGWAVYMGTIYALDLTLPGLQLRNGQLLVQVPALKTQNPLKTDVAQGIQFLATPLLLSLPNWQSYNFYSASADISVEKWNTDYLYSPRCLHLLGNTAPTGYIFFGQLLLHGATLNTTYNEGIKGNLCQLQFANTRAYPVMDILCEADQLGCVCDNHLLGCVNLSAFIEPYCATCAGPLASTYLFSQQNFIFKKTSLHINTDHYFDVRIHNFSQLILGVCKSNLSLACIPLLFFSQPITAESKFSLLGSDVLLIKNKGGAFFGLHNLLVPYTVMTVLDCCGNFSTCWFNPMTLEYTNTSTPIPIVAWNLTTQFEGFEKGKIPCGNACFLNRSFMFQNNVSCIYALEHILGNGDEYKFWLKTLQSYNNLQRTALTNLQNWVLYLDNKNNVLTIPNMQYGCNTGEYCSDDFENAYITALYENELSVMDYSNYNGEIIWVHTCQTITTTTTTTTTTTPWDLTAQFEGFPAGAIPCGSACYLHRPFMFQTNVSCSYAVEEIFNNGTQYNVWLNTLNGYNILQTQAFTNLQNWVLYLNNKNNVMTIPQTLQYGCNVDQECSNMFISTYLTGLYVNKNDEFDYTNVVSEEIDVHVCQTKTTTTTTTTTTTIAWNRFALEYEKNPCGNCYLYRSFMGQYNRSCVEVLSLLKVNMTAYNEWLTTLNNFNILQPKAVYNIEQWLIYLENVIIPPDHYCSAEMNYEYIDGLYVNAAGNVNNNVISTTVFPSNFNSEAILVNVIKSCECYVLLKTLPFVLQGVNNIPDLHPSKNIRINCTTWNSDFVSNTTFNDFFKEAYLTTTNEKEGINQVYITESIDAKFLVSFNDASFQSRDGGISFQSLSMAITYIDKIDLRNRFPDPVGMTIAFWSTGDDNNDGGVRQANSVGFVYNTLGKKGCSYPPDTPTISPTSYVQHFFCCDKKYYFTLDHCTKICPTSLTCELDKCI